MIIPHLVQLGSSGLGHDVPVHVIETRPQNSKKIPFNVLDSALAEPGALTILHKVDPSNFVPPGAKARAAVLADPTSRFFRGIPMDARGITQTTSLVKLLHLLYYSRWYQNLIQQGLLDSVDARQRITDAQTVSDPKAMGSQKNPDQGCQLPTIGKTPEGKWVVLGLRKPTGILASVDESLSVRLTREVLRTEGGSDRKIATISLELQTSEGRGRNLFGKVNHLPKLLPQKPDEAARVFGQDAVLDAGQCLEQFNRLPRYRLKVGENPETSHLLFIPSRVDDLEGIATAVEDAVSNNKLHRSEQGKKHTAEQTETKPVFLPIPKRRLKSKILLIYKEGGKKGFWIVSNLFPEVPIYYWQVLNEYLYPIQGAYPPFFNACLANHKSKTFATCAYQAWTRLFTAALNREGFDPFEVWRSYPTYLRSFSNQELVEGEFRKGRALLTIIPRLRKLHQLINIMSEESHLELDTGEIAERVTAATSDPESEKTRALVGDLWDELRDWHRDQLVRVHRQVAGGIPDRDLSAYLKGALCGILLSNLVYQLSSEKVGIERRFDLSAGMHLTNLRGSVLMDRFRAAKDLINGLPERDKVKVFPLSRSLMNHLVGMTELSRTDAFNAGFVSNC